MVSPIANGCLKLSIDVQVEPQLVPKLLFWVSVRELHNIVVIPPEEVIINEARGACNNIIISYSTLRNILPPQLENMTSNTRLFVVVSVVYLPKVCILPC